MTRFGGMSRDAIRADGSTDLEKIPGLCFGAGA